jgi:hypothetical protein
VAKAFWVQFFPINPATGLEVELFFTSLNSPAGTGLITGKTFYPFIESYPTLTINSFEGDFNGVAATTIEDLKITYGPVIGSAIMSYVWDGARAIVYKRTDAENVTIGGGIGQVTAIFTGVVEGSPKVEDASATFSISDKSYLLDVDCLDLKYAGTGGIEGPDNYKGNFKPMAIGRPIGVEPTLVEPAFLTYQYNAYGRSGGVVNLSENGLLFGSPTTTVAWAGSIAATYTALKGLSLTLGQWADAPSIGFFRLGGEPVSGGVLVCDVIGVLNGSSVPIEYIPDVVSYLLGRTAVGGAINSSSISTFNTSIGNLPISEFYDQQTKVNSVLANIIGGAGGYYIFDKSGNFATGLVRINASPTLTINSDGSTYPLFEECKSNGISAPHKTIRMGAQQTFRVHTVNEISSALKAAVEAAATTATWPSVTGAGKPQDNANNTSVDANGAIQGVSAGSGTTVDNTRVLVGARNLMINSGQFANISDWSSNGATISLDTSVLYGSFNTLKIVGLYGAAKNTVMRLKPSTQYTVSAMVKGSSAISGGGDTHLHIQNWRDEDTGNVHQDVAVSSDTSITTSWKLIYYTFTTPSSAALTYCRFYFYPLETGFTLNVGYVKLEEGNKATDWIQAPEELTSGINSAATTANWPSVTGTGRPQDNATVGADASNLAVSLGGGNLVKNSSFEGATYAFGSGRLAAGYSPYYNSETVVPSLVAGRTGGLAQQVAWTANTTTKGIYFDEQGGVNNRLMFQPNTTFMLSFYAKASGGAIGNAMQTAWNTAPTVTAVSNPSLTTGWQRYVFRLVWGGSVDPNGFISITGGTANSTSSIAFDDIQVEVGDYVSAYGPNSTNTDLVLFNAGTNTLTFSANSATSGATSGYQNQAAAYQTPLTGTAYAEMNISKDYSVMSLQISGAGTSVYTDQDLYVSYFAPSGNLVIYRLGTLVLNITIATNLTGKIAIAYDGVNYRFFVAGVEYGAGLAGMKASASGLTHYARWFCWDALTTYTGLRVLPFTENVWANVGGAGKPEDYATRGVNLVYNGDAENGTTGWVIDAVYGAAPSLGLSSATTQIGGSKSFALYKPSVGDGANIVGRRIAVVPGKDYVFRCKVLGSATTSSGLYLRLNLASSSFTGDAVLEAIRDAGYHDFIASGPITDSQITTYEFTWTCPSGVYFVSPAVYLWIGGPLQIYVDDISLVEVFPLPKGEQVVFNGDAEQGTTLGWVLGQTNGITTPLKVSTAQKQSGTYSFQITKPSTADGVGYSARAVSVQPGETYVMRAWTYNPNSATSNGFYFRLMQSATKPTSGYLGAGSVGSYADGTGSIVDGPGQSNAAIPANATDWGEWVYTVPAGIYWVSPAIYSWASGPTNMFFEISMKRQSSWSAGIGGVGKPSNNAGTSLNLISLVGAGGLALTQSGNALLCAGGSGWQQGSVSKDTAVSGARASCIIESVGYFMMGLTTKTNPGPVYTEIDYALYCASTSGYVIYPGGLSPNVNATLTPTVGDNMLVVSDDVKVRYFVNGTLIHVMNVNATSEKLRFMISFVSGSVTDCQFNPLISNDFANSGGTTKPENNADVTLLVSPPSASVTLSYDYTGTIKASQTKTIQYNLKSGAGTDVTTSATWNAALISGNATFTLGSSTGLLSVTDVTSNAVISVIANYLSKDRLASCSVVRHVDPPPTGGGGGSGTTASTGVISNTTSSSYGSPNTSDLVVTIGSGGTATLSFSGDFYKTSNGTGTAFGKWQRDISGTWTDVASESTYSYNSFTDTSDGTSDPGYLVVNQTVTGLTASSSQSFRLLLRNGGGAYTHTWDGLAVVVGS